VRFVVGKIAYFSCSDSSTLNSQNIYLCMLLVILLMDLVVILLMDLVHYG
jgi:hypothetical protein